MAGDLENAKKAPEAHPPDLRVDGPRTKIHEGPVEGDGATGPAELPRHSGVITVGKAFEDGAVEGDLRVDPLPENLVEMFLEELIEGDMDLQMAQDVLHCDHPENKQC